MKIISPIATGSGAFVLHKMLQEKLTDYDIVPYHPLKTLFPPLLHREGKTRSADIIHSAVDYGFFHYRVNIPLVLTIHSYALDLYMKPFLSTLQNVHRVTDLNWITKMSLNRATHLTAVSEYVAEKAKTELSLPTPISVIYNGIDHDRFVPKNRNSRKLKVLFCGNLSLRKGAQWLPSIADKLSSNIIIQYTSGLRDIPDSYNHPQLECVGKVEYKNMHKLYQNADIFLFPTVREGFGLVVAEAMSCGLPVVASNCSAIPELVDDQLGGYLCPVGDTNAFSNAINTLSDNPELREHMGEYNRVKVENKFTLIRMIKEYQQFFEQCLG